MPRHAILAAALLALAAAAARAEDACTAEVNRLCPRSRGDLEVLSCLRANEAALARACPGDLDVVMSKAATIGAGCAADVKKLCPAVQPGGGRLAECLRSQQQLLTTSCQEAFNEWRLGRMNLTAACAGDIGKWCPQVPEGSGRILRCLKEHQADLTSDCRSALQRI